VTKTVSCLFAALCFAQVSAAQQSLAVRPFPDSAALSLPDAPAPNLAPPLAATESSSQQPAQSPSNPSSSTSQPAPAQAPDQAPAPETDEERKARAAAELKIEETQRIAGIIPNFNAVNNGKAAPITPGQKFQLFFHGSVDPYQFALAGIDALIGQAEDSNRGYNQGLKGFARRYGANYGDNFDGNFWGNAVLPSLLHQDPRYFRMGHGPFLHRALYSISTTFRAHGDNGHWQPNVSNLTGNLIGAAISNVYYPDDDRGLYPTLRRGLSVTYQGTIGALLIEFYPDVSNHFKNRHAAKLAARQAAINASHTYPTQP
jgi:hypothetical protein